MKQLLLILSVTLGLATTANADNSTNYAVKYVSPGDTNLDFGSTQGFAAAMAVALG